MNIKQKRKAGEILERGGIAQRIINIAEAISSGTYVDAMKNAGRIAELVDAATYDDYWKEKTEIGRYAEQTALSRLTEGKEKRERIICEI